MHRKQVTSPDRYQASREGFFGTTTTTADEEELGLGSPDGPSFTLHSPLVQIAGSTSKTAATFAEQEDDEEVHNDNDEAATVTTTTSVAPVSSGSASPRKWISSWFSGNTSSQVTATAASSSTHAPETDADVANKPMSKKEKKRDNKTRNQEATKAARAAATMAVTATTASTPMTARKAPVPIETGKKQSASSSSPPASKRTSGVLKPTSNEKVLSSSSPLGDRFRSRRSDVRPGMYHHHAVLQPLSWKDFCCDGNADVIIAPSRTTFTISGATKGEDDKVVLNPNSMEAILQRVEARIAAKQLVEQEEQMEVQRRIRAKEERAIARRALSAAKAKKAGWGGLSWVSRLFKGSKKDTDAATPTTQQVGTDESNNEDDIDTLNSDVSPINDAETSDDDGSVDPDFVPRYLSDKGRSVSGVSPHGIARSLAESFDGGAVDEDEEEETAASYDAECTLEEGGDFGENSKLRWKRRLDRLAGSDTNTKHPSIGKRKSTAVRAGAASMVMISPDGNSPQPLLPSTTNLSDAAPSATSQISGRGSTATPTTTTKAGKSFTELTQGRTTNPTPRNSGGGSCLHELADRLQTGALADTTSTAIPPQLAPGILRLPGNAEQLANFQFGQDLTDRLKEGLEKARSHEPKYLAELEAKKKQSDLAKSRALRRSQKDTSSRRVSAVMDEEEEVVVEKEALHSYGLTTPKANSYLARMFTVEELITFLDHQNIYFERSSETLFRASHRPSEARHQLIFRSEEEIEEAEANADDAPILAIPVATMSKTELLEHAMFVLERQM